MSFHINNSVANVSFSSDALPSRLSPAFAADISQISLPIFSAIVSCGLSDLGFTCPIDFVVDSSLIHYDAVLGPNFAVQCEKAGCSALLVSIPKYPGGYLPSISSKFFVTFYLTQNYDQPRQDIIDAALSALADLKARLPQDVGFLIVSPPHGNDKRLTVRIFDRTNHQFIGTSHFYLGKRRPMY